MKSKDQQLLEEAYDDVVKKMVAGSNNPGWSLERGLTSGKAFQGLPEPKGGWPDREGKKKKSAPKQNPKAVEKAKEDDELDVEGDPVGNYQSIATPQPEEDPTASMMFVSNEDLKKIYYADESLFEKIFKGSEEAIEKPEGIVFRYLAPQVRQKMEQRMQSILNK